jgi:hypothetical protein
LSQDKTLGPKGTGPGIGTDGMPVVDVVPSAYRRHLNHAGKQAEQGKPDALPPGREVARPTEGAAGKRMGNQGLLGESEGRAVMAGIRVRDLPGAKASANAAFDDFQQVSRHEETGQTTFIWESRWRQARPAGAPIGGNARLLPVCQRQLEMPIVLPQIEMPIPFL